MKKNKSIRENKDFLEMLGKQTDKEVAEKWGVSLTYVFKIRTELGISPCRKWGAGAKPYHVLPSVEEIKKEVAELGSMNKVALKYGVSRQAVQQRLERSKCSQIQ